MTEIRLDRVRPNGVELQVTVAGSGPLVVLVHGFPELAYSWRHQIGVLADEGYTVVAPDMRGYGGSECPDAIADYGMFDLVGDVVGLISHYGEGEPAVVVGHDWGSWIVYATALFRPDLLRGVSGISVPYTPRFDQSLVELLQASVGDGFHYILYFQEPGVAEEELDADPIDTMRRILWIASGDMELLPVDTTGERVGFVARDVPDGLPAWLNQGDLDAYAQAFIRTGFTGGINYYRNIHRNWEQMAPWHLAPITVPMLFIGGRRDPVLTGTGDLDGEHPVLVTQQQFVPDLRTALIHGAGHWTQQERPSETSAALLDFLAEVHPR